MKKEPTAYVTPEIQTISGSSLLELLGPAQGYQHDDLMRMATERLNGGVERQP